MKITNYKDVNSSINVFHPIPNFPMLDIAVVCSNNQRKNPTGYAILKQKGRDDCMIVNRNRKGEIYYDAMILKQHVLPVLSSYHTLRVELKRNGHFTIVGKYWNGKNRTLAMSIIHEFSGNKIDPDLVPHHPDGDPTNNLYVMPLDNYTHGLFHKLMQCNTTPYAILDVVESLGNKTMKEYYCSPEHFDSYSSKTYEMCEKIHEHDFFGWMLRKDYYQLIDAIRHEFDT